MISFYLQKDFERKDIILSSRFRFASNQSFAFKFLGENFQPKLIISYSNCQRIFYFLQRCLGWIILFFNLFDLSTFFGCFKQKSSHPRSNFPTEPPKLKEHKASATKKNFKNSFFLSNIFFMKNRNLNRSRVKKAKKIFNKSMTQHY